MMNILGDIVLPLAQAAVQESGSMFSNLGADGIGAGGAATGLAAVWFFFKVIRKIIATLFMFCIAYLVCKCCFGLDISGWITPLLHLSGN